MEKKYYLPTFLGRKLDLSDPDPSDILMEDIAHALGKQCRYAGHPFCHYSVAEHCVRMARVASDEYKWDTLMHDSAESAFVDLPRPVKYLPGIREIYEKYESKYFAIIARKFDLNPVMPAEVKALDDAIINQELERIFIKNIASKAYHKQDNENKWNFFPDEDYGWTAEKAKYEFLKMVYVLRPNLTVV